MCFVTFPLSSVSIKVLSSSKAASNTSSFSPATVSIHMNAFVVSSENPLHSVKNVFNAILVKGNMVADTMYYGKGAGKLATASAVMADVCDIAKNSDPRVFSWGEEKAVVSKFEGGEDLFVALDKSCEAAVRSVYSDVSFVYSGDMCAFILKDADKNDVKAKLAGAGEIACIIPVMQ